MKNSLLVSIFVISTLQGCAQSFSPTEYVGGAFGVVERQISVGGGPTVFGPDGKPYLMPVMVGGLVVYVPPLNSARFYQYEIREKDGTLHLVQDGGQFQVGACVEFAGSADGPSRLSWSRGRVELHASDKCSK